MVIKTVAKESVIAQYNRIRFDFRLATVSLTAFSSSESHFM